MKRLGMAFACAAATGLAVSLVGPASAAESSAQYVLTVQHENSGESTRVTLDCDPVAGDHPNAPEACESIAAAGSIEEIEPEDGVCTMDSRPVTATAEGYEDYEETFGNPCLLHLAKGPVFDF